MYESIEHETADDANIDLHACGKRSFFVWSIAEVRNDSESFKIAPTRLPIAAIIGQCVCILTIFGIVEYLYGRLFHSLVFTSIGMLASVALAAIMAGVTFGWFSHQVELGPWLVFDKTDQRIQLPRYIKSFAINEIVHLQAVRSRLSPAAPRGKRKRQYSELHLVTIHDGKCERWHFQDCFGRDALGFQDLLLPLIKATPIPVVQVRESAATDKLLVQPFEKRRYQFSIRSLLLATTAIATAAAVYVATDLLGLMLVVLIFLGANYSYQGHRMARWEESLLGGILMVLTIAVLCCLLLGMLAT